VSFELKSYSCTITSLVPKLCVTVNDVFELSPIVAENVLSPTVCIS